MLTTWPVSGYLSPGISQYIQPTPTEKVCNTEKAPRKNSKPSQHCTDEHNKTVPKSLEKLTSTEKQHPNTSQTHQLPIATHLLFWSFQTEAALWYMLRACGVSPVGWSKEGASFRLRLREQTLDWRTLSNGWKTILSYWNGSFLGDTVMEEIPLTSWWDLIGSLFHYCICRVLYIPDGFSPDFFHQHWHLPGGRTSKRIVFQLQCSGAVESIFGEYHSSTCRFSKKLAI